MAMVAMASVLHGAALAWDGYGYNPHIQYPPDDPGPAWIDGGRAYLVWVYENDGSLNVSYSGGAFVVTGGEIVDTSIPLEGGGFGGTFNGAEVFWGGTAKPIYLAALVFTDVDDDGKTWYWGVGAVETYAWTGESGGFSFDGDAYQGTPTWNIVIIPEPATAMLALAGIGLLMAQKRRRA